MFQHTAARRRLDTETQLRTKTAPVSTHSRPKAAGSFLIGKQKSHEGFNTQPPEGGWLELLMWMLLIVPFQHTAARRRLESCRGLPPVSKQSFNTQPPEGGWIYHEAIAAHLRQFQHTAARRRLERKASNIQTGAKVSTHSRPKAAG